MAVRKKTKVFFLTPTKKLKLRMACGLEKDVPGSEKREAASHLQAYSIDNLYDHMWFPVTFARSQKEIPCLLHVRSNVAGFLGFKVLENVATDKNLRAGRLSSYWLKICTRSPYIKESSWRCRMQKAKSLPEKD